MPHCQELPPWAPLTPAEVLLTFWKVLKVLLSVPSAGLAKGLLCVAKAVSPAKTISLESLTSL